MDRRLPGRTQRPRARPRITPDPRPSSSPRSAAAGPNPRSTDETAALVAAYIRALDTRRTTVLELVGNTNGVVTEHLSSDIIRIEIAP